MLQAQAGQLDLLQVGILDCLKKFLLNTITLLFPLEIYIIHTTQREFLPNAKPIFGILKANGYKTVLFLGSNSNFSGMKNCFPMHGHFEILYINYWQQKDGILINIKALVGDSLSPSFLQEQKKNT